ncbi:MAG: ABC transporter ATP-binding protein [Candidatus Hydrogenedentes bacterium]|nr:ABC transporter ATP-binding protein [Candidatus Hydrogenedentota bacterium]
MITLTDITKVYGEGAAAIHALGGVSMTVEPGESVAIMGPSGSGKTTLLNIVGLLDAPDNGGYRLFDHEVFTRGDRELSHLRNETFGFVFQSFNLLPRYTAVENVEVPLRYSNRPRKDRRERAMEALRKVGLADRALHTPSELSGGQQQRVAIARALANEPKVILADEPTGNLDSTSAQGIMDVLGTLNENGMTLIMITHAQEIAARAKRIVQLRDGRIADGGA